MSWLDDEIDDQSMFDAQFEPLGDGFAFRASFKKPPVRVTIDEYHQAVADYERFSFFFPLCFMAAVILLALVTSVFFRNISDIYEFIALAGIAVFVHFVSRWAYDAPSRKFRDRFPVGSALPAEEVRRIRDSFISWSHVAVLGLTGAFGVVGVMMKPSPLRLEASSLIAVLLLALAIYGALRKLRHSLPYFEQRN